ncbi:MAG: GNAT family N-acetyltransferase, partial [Candidatus Latescibacteria bacterium]|nr:GNAT family N-acetyltransferase [Candidatus Latescibacterota bacterium]
VPDEFHLADFAIRPSLQRRGLGRRLLDRVLADLGGRSVNLVSLEVRASNAPAIRLYSGAGFQTIAVREGYYSRPKEDALVMLKALRGEATDWAEVVAGRRLRDAQNP